MKVTLSDIQNAKDVLSRLANTDLPIKTSYLLSKLIKKLNEEYNTIEELRTQLIKKYGEVEGDNIRVVPGTEGFGSFINEYGAFMNTEIEIPMSLIDIDVNQTDFPVKPIDLIYIDKFANLIGFPPDSFEEESVEDVAE